jgi:Tol biopolymer transport system component
MLSPEPLLIQALALSPKGDQIVASLGISSGQANDIWIYNLVKNNKTKLTFDQRCFSPVWSPDGGRIAFERVKPDRYEITVKDVAGAGSEEVVYKETKRALPVAWSPDGKYLIYRLGLVSSEIKALSMTGDHKATTLVTTKLGWAGVALSPDGKWLAYVSDESGVPEVYVVPFQSGVNGPSIGNGKWQATNTGSTSPMWRPDGKELFLVTSAGMGLASASVAATGDRLEIDSPKYLFDLGAHPTGFFYTPSRDGQKIYMSTYGPGSSAPITVTVNWQRLLKK